MTLSFARPLLDLDPGLNIHLNTHPVFKSKSKSKSQNHKQMMRQENLRLLHEQNQMKEKIAENAGKIKQNKVLPYLVGNVVEVSVWEGRFACPFLRFERGDGGGVVLFERGGEGKRSRWFRGVIGG
jgi:hypothetical protein